MKVRDSGMPDRAYWEGLFDLDAILGGLEIDGRVGDVVEVGCGYGTFTLPVARRIRGTLFSVDIERAMIEETRKRIEQAGIDNVKLLERDVIAAGFPVPAQSMDAVLLFNILHLENPVDLLASSAEILRPGGRVLIIHWRSDVETPRGPALSIRPRPEQVIDWAQRTGMLALEGAPRVLPPWHFGLTLRRVAASGPSIGRGR